MKRLFVLLTMLAMPVWASAADDTKSDQILKQLVEIQKTIDKMNKDLDARATKNEADLTKIRADVDALTKRVAEMQKAPPTVMKTDPPKIKVEEGPLPPTVPFKETRPTPPPTTARVSFLPDIKNGDSTVLIRNTWVATANVYVNGERYVVAPGTSQAVRVIPGTFTYYVVEVHGYNSQTRPISPDETFTIVVETQRSYYPCR